MSQEKNSKTQNTSEKLLLLNTEILTLENEKGAQLKKNLLNITDISFKKTKELNSRGYISKPSWDGKVIKKQDFDYINQKYNDRIDALKNKIEEIKNNNIDEKKAENELDKLKIDNTLIANRTKELIEQGYTDEAAKEIAGLESVIDISKKRVAIYISAPTIKDQEQRLAAVQKTIQNNDTRLQELLKIESVNKNTISNKQKIRSAEEEIRKIGKDEKNIYETKIALINQGYQENDALKIAELIDIIAGDEKRKEILINNQGIQNGQKELAKVEKRLIENKTILEKLKTDSVKQVPKNPNEQNKNASEKEDGVKTIKEKLMGFFRRKEKQKVEVYTEEEEKAWILFIKTELEKGTDKLKVQEFILRHNEEKRKLEVEKGPLSPRIKSGITNGIKDWDNWGSEGGWSGYSKKMLKMTASITLIAGVSTFSVEHAANIGWGTASALTSGRTVNKLLIGLGFGTAMELTNGMTAEKRKKLQKIVSLGMMAISAGIAIGTGGGIIAGAAVGGSAAFGYIFSQLVQKGFSEEKIKAKLDAIKNRPINIATLDEDLAKIEKETKEILRYAENTRLLRKLVGGTVAIVASVGMLEASGHVKDLHTENQANIEKTEAETKPIEDQDGTSKNDSVQEKQNEVIKSDSTETKTLISDTTNMTKESDTTNSQNEASVTEDKIQDDVNQNQEKFDEIKIEFSSKGAIETIKDLQEKINTDYPKEVPAHLEDFAKADPTQMAIKLGLYNPGDNNGNESAMLIKGSTLGFDEHGNLSIYDIKTGEDHILIEEKGTADLLEKYNGKMFDSDHSSYKIETSTDTQGEHNDYKVPEQINPETGLLMNGSENNHQGTEDTEHSTNSNESSSNLSPERLEHVHKIFDNNIDHLFRERPMSAWIYIKDHVSATRIMEMYKEGEIKEDFKPLTHYMNQLQNITGIRPQGVDLLHHDPETIPHFIGRALEEAERTGQIDKVTL